MNIHRIHFFKCQGYGNDFLIIEESKIKGCGMSSSQIAEKICSRKFSIGADGLILWSTSKRSSHFKARVFNADGSEAETSGNGLRCLATFLRHEGIVEQENIFIETLGGIINLYFLKQDHNHFQFRTNLGLPSFTPSDIPITAVGLPYPVRDFPIEAGGTTFSATLLSTGNPHCVIKVEEIDFPVLYQCGPLLEVHPLFPSRANVEFVRVINRSTIEVAIWERGVGHTFSSGTGSAAAAVAAILNNWTDNSVLVQMEGGEILVKWRDGSDIIQDGTAQFVCCGTIESISLQY